VASVIDWWRKIGGEHRPVNTDLQQNLEKRWDPGEFAEREVTLWRR
jgi:hypothetical protein